eukprot:GILK01005596.1.p1 GENE.GILK01005596.1~~GILK01005596.1.p1  ORF type:complete len:578 (-),score=98.10 GILK01005596.1:78-1811(-)
MEAKYVYTKRRRQFGRHPRFTDLDAQILAEVAEDKTPERLAEYSVRNPTSVVLDNIPDMSIHQVNTARVVMKTNGMVHVEGGWAKEVDVTDFEATERYRKKQQKEDGYARCLVDGGKVARHCINQNNAIDIYEEYFEGESEGIHSESPSTKTINIFRDSSNANRMITSISWHPEGPKKMAASYSLLKFQEGGNVPSSSYIWDVNNPNTPEMEIIPQSPLVCLLYNPKDPHFLVGGSYNGLIGFWDTRKGSHPLEVSVIERSHHDPVYDIVWVQSKSGMECASVSTDGQVLWWDTRRLGEPIDSLQLESDTAVLGGISLEYEIAAGPTKLLIGTEQGVVFNCNRKAKNPKERITNEYRGHHGPVRSVKRNPQNMKFFLTIGDWTARIWTEDLKTPILSTKYHKHLLTDGAWSPTRPGVFLTTKIDGTLDVWDIFYHQNEPIQTQQVSEHSLKTLSIQEAGRYAAVGDTNGCISLIELSEGLYVQQSGEKTAIAQMFDRESKRERNLENQRKKAKGGRGTMTDDSTYGFMNESNEEVETLIKQVDSEFYTTMNSAIAENGEHGSVSTQDGFNGHLEDNI